MKIAVLANLTANAPVWDDMSPDQWDDLDSPKTVEILCSTLGKLGHTAEFLEANINPPFVLREKLESFQPDLCLNIAEGHFGDGREAHIPSVLEMMRLPYTGSRVITLAMALDKPLTKRVLHYHDLPTPEFQVFGTADEAINEDLTDGGELRFPLFVKPSREGTGIGVTTKSVVQSIEELRERVKEMLARYNQPVLCERYIDGRELTVGLIGNLGPTAARRLNDRTAPELLPEELTFFPALEVDTSKYGESEGGIYTNRIKTDLVDTFHYTCPARIDTGLADHLNRLSAAVFRVLGCLDISRVDFRLDREGNPYILEINPLPGLNPDYSDLPIEAKAAGWSYDRLIKSLVDLAAERWGIKGE